MERPSILERLRAFNRWTNGWAASSAVAVGIWIVLRSYLIEAFRIPSASMENTLLVGDFLFVNKAIYGGELEIPLTGIRCCRLPGYAEPQRDGIVVFRSVADRGPAAHYLSERRHRPAADPLEPDPAAALTRPGGAVRTPLLF